MFALEVLINWVNDYDKNNQADFSMENDIEGEPFTPKISLNYLNFLNLKLELGTWNKYQNRIYEMQVL